MRTYSMAESLADALLGTEPKPVDPLTPKEARYSGIWFRSRLEARWARFFDCLGIEWFYEPIKVRLSSGEGYIPDFWLPGLQGGTWAEVKPDGDPFVKAMQFCMDFNKPVWLCDGWPRERNYAFVDCPQGPRLKFLLTADHKLEQALLPGDGSVMSLPRLPRWELIDGRNCLVAEYLDANKVKRLDANDPYFLWVQRIILACSVCQNMRFDEEELSERKANQRLDELFSRWKRGPANA